MWDDIEVLTGANENVKKFVFKRQDAIAEAVLYKYPTYEDRTVMCISTQSGCAMGCTFCGTGNKFIKNLNEEEIQFQVAEMLKHVDVHHTKIKRWQIMFMSMGEPMLNYFHLSRAINGLHNDYKQAALLISTAAPKVSHYRHLANLSEKIPAIGLQFSVHESTQEARDKLIPFKNKLTLQEIAETGRMWAHHSGRKPFFNYCVHEANNSDEDVQRLVDLFDPNLWEATISVICESDETMEQSILRQEELARNFSNKMLAAGYSTRVFNPAGQDDIGGGCGQLWQVQKWMKEKELA